jgi:hypothetical protein
MGIFDYLFGKEDQNSPNYINEGQDYTQQAVNTLSNAGITDPRIYNPNLQFTGREKSYDNDRSVRAWIDREEDPYRVNVVRPAFGESNPLKDPYAMQHEVEHIGKSGKFTTERVGPNLEYPIDVDRNVIMRDNYAELTGLPKKEADKKIFDFARRALNYDVGAHIKENYGVSPAYIGSKASPGMNSIEELASDLGSIQSVSKKDIYSDPYLQRKLFNNDPHMMEAYRSIVNQYKMDAKDPTPYTAYKENIPRYQGLIDKYRAEQKPSGILESISEKLGYKAGGFIDKPIKGGSKSI